MQKITIVGIGYMGLPTALLLAKVGYEVSGFDINKQKVRNINNGVLPFNETGLDKLYIDAKSNFSATTILKPSDIFIISVPTPISRNRTCDLSYVIKAANDVKNVLKDGDLVILESTVKPGTTINNVKPILDKKKVIYDLAYVAEKAIPGNTIYEMQNNTRIIGQINDSGKRVREIYSKFVHSKIIITDTITAEAVKLMENTFRDVNIALANELFILSEQLGINVWKAISLANLHPRVNIHNPSVGVGGHCIPIDPWFLIQDTKLAKLISVARNINEKMPEYIFQKIKMKVKKGQTISILGVAYKPDVDDVRESPVLKLIDLCEKNGYNVKVHDPYVPGYEKNIQKVISDTDLIIISTGHNIYTKFNYKDTPILDIPNILQNAI